MYPLISLAIFVLSLILPAVSYNGVAYLGYEMWLQSFLLILILLTFKFKALLLQVFWLVNFILLASMYFSARGKHRLAIAFSALSIIAIVTYGYYPYAYFRELSGLNPVIGSLEVGYYFWLFSPILILSVESFKLVLSHNNRVN